MDHYMSMTSLFVAAQKIWLPSKEKSNNVSRGNQNGPWKMDSKFQIIKANAYNPAKSTKCTNHSALLLNDTEINYSTSKTPSQMMTFKQIHNNLHHIQDTIKLHMKQKRTDTFLTLHWPYLHNPFTPSKKRRHPNMHHVQSSPHSQTHPLKLLPFQTISSKILTWQAT